MLIAKNLVLIAKNLVLIAKNLGINWLQTLVFNSEIKKKDLAFDSEIEIEITNLMQILKMQFFH